LTQICRWNFNAGYDSFRGISISGFVSYFQLSVVIEIIIFCMNSPWSIPPGLQLQNNTLKRMVAFYPMRNRRA